MEGEGGGIFRSSNRTRGNQDGRREGERFFRLADSKRSQGCTEVFRNGELLLLIHYKFCSDS